MEFILAVREMERSHLVKHIGIYTLFPVRFLCFLYGKRTSPLAET